MRFLANENFPDPGIQLLRSNGFYVKSIKEELPGVKDSTVMEIAKTENLTILTFDKDYGEMIFRYGIINPPAVIFFRYNGLSPSFAGHTVLRFLTDKSIDFSANFTIIEKKNVRQRKYL